MRGATPIPFALLVLASLVPAAIARDAPQQSAASETQSELLKLETQWNEAHLRGDAAALERLWADELIVTVQEMPVMDKIQALAIVRSGRVKFKRYTTSELKVNVFGDSAVVTGHLNRVRERQGQEFEDNWRFTKVLVRRGGKWQVVAWHGSQAAK